MHKPLTVAALAAAIALSWASPAGAHVTVSPSTAAKGSYATLTFKVPNEKSTASTTSVEIDLPADHPMRSVSVQPKPGWTYQVDPPEGPARKVVWSGGTVRPGEFDTFSISVGPLPQDAGSLAFKALQTYSDGDVVRWIEPQEGQDEPQHPAPTITLTGAGTDQTTSTAAASPDATDPDEGRNLLVVMVPVLLVASLIGLGALVVIRRRRR